MKAVVQLFWQICLLRQGPEQVPTAKLVHHHRHQRQHPLQPGAVIALDDSSSFISVLTRLLVTQATTAALVWLALFLRETATFPGHLTALFGCDLIITVCFGSAGAVVQIIGDGGSTFIFLGFHDLVSGGGRLHHASCAERALWHRHSDCRRHDGLSVATSEVAVNPV